MRDFAGKKIAILGLGEENSALVTYLKDKGAHLTICDRKGREELGDSLEKFKNIKDLEFDLGPGYLENLKNFDIVFRTPGLPYLDLKIQEAKRAGVEISSETKLFLELCPSPVLGVTGTKGKGTTTTLIGNILKASGLGVYVGGNLGTPPISFLDKLSEGDIVVLELSSFQLQDLKKSPHIAVVLDIKSDHLDYHSGQNEYVEAKKTIVEHQAEKDFAVINADYLTSFEFATSTPAQTYFFSRRKSVDLGAFFQKDKIILRTGQKDIEIVTTNDIKLRGEHNIENICAAIIASYLAGADIEAIKSAVREFKGLEHRLELVGEQNGVKFYNDSFSTTPDTTIAAIESFTQPLILLLGGSEKNADYQQLTKIIAQNNIKLIIPIGETAKRIVPGFGEIKTMEEALKLALEKAVPGDVILLSPASASFDHFKNYKDRGNLFKRLVNLQK